MNHVPDLLRLTIPLELRGERLDKALAQLAPELTRSTVQRLIASGAVRVNGVAADSPSAKAVPESLVVIAIPPPTPVELSSEPIPLVILHEDPHLIVIDKPAGLAVHPGAGQPAGTLVNALLHHCRDLSGIGGELRPGIVHRLDQDTSGVLVVAKDDRTHQGLAAQFKDHSTTRRYLALVLGEPSPLAGRVAAPIGRHPKERQRMAVVAVGKGREAVTHYRTRERFTRLTLVECGLETGRTHQIRVHLAHLGHPLLGDPTYGRRFTPPAAWPEELRLAIQALERQALHAAVLGFEHPITRQRLQFSTPPPEDLSRIIEGLRSLKGAVTTD